MKRFWFVIVLAGLMVAAYPFIDRAYSWYLQTRIFEEINRSMEIVQEDADTTQYVGLQDIFEESFESVDREPTEAELAESAPLPDPAEPPEPPLEKGDIIGILDIEKINLRLPILYGASRSNLKAGAGQIAGTTAPGQIGNSALAAHRSHTFGRFFNRLDELEIGDKIRVKTDRGIFSYVVYKKHIVSPSDLSVLRKNNRDRIITLVTCDPIDTATHRLIVHGVILEDRQNLN